MTVRNKVKRLEALPAGHVPLDEIPRLSEGERILLKSCFISHGMPLADGRFEVSIFCMIGLQKMRWHIFRGNGTEISNWKYIFRGQPDDHVPLEDIKGLSEGEKKFLALRGMSHGIKIPGDRYGRFEVSGLKVVGGRMSISIYRGKGQNKRGWKRAVNE